MMPTTTAQKQRPRILMMVNDQDMLTLINRTLELEGYDAMVVGNFNETMNHLEETNPDMVILATFVPDNSIQTLDTIRESSDVPVIVITADSQVDTLETVFAHGADDFIRKPFGVKPLIARIRAVLRRYHGETLQ